MSPCTVARERGWLWGAWQDAPGGTEHTSLTWGRDTATVILQTSVHDSRVLWVLILGLWDRRGQAGCDYRIIELLRLQKNPLRSQSPSINAAPLSPAATSKCLLNTSRDGDSVEGAQF